MRRLWTREQLVARKQHKPVILRRRDVPSPCQACKQVDDRAWLLRKPLRHGKEFALRLQWLCWFCADWPAADAPLDRVDPSSAV